VAPYDLVQCNLVQCGPVRCFICKFKTTSFIQVQNLREKQVNQYVEVKDWVM